MSLARPWQLLLVSVLIHAGCDVGGVDEQDVDSIAVATAAVLWLQDPWLDTRIGVDTAGDVPAAVTLAVRDVLDGTLIDFSTTQFCSGPHATTSGCVGATVIIRDLELDNDTATIHVGVRYPPSPTGMMMIHDWVLLLSKERNTWQVVRVISEIVT